LGEGGYRSRALCHMIVGNLLAHRNRLLPSREKWEKREKPDPGRLRSSHIPPVVNVSMIIPAKYAGERMKCDR
jgi:hypothetical protein